jgi:hypothetical protein
MLTITLYMLGFSMTLQKLQSESLDCLRTSQWVFMMEREVFKDWPTTNIEEFMKQSIDEEIKRLEQAIFAQRALTVNNELAVKEKKKVAEGTDIAEKVEKIWTQSSILNDKAPNLGGNGEKKCWGKIMEHLRKEKSGVEEETEEGKKNEGKDEKGKASVHYFNSDPLLCDSAETPSHELLSHRRLYSSSSGKNRARKEKTKP